MTTTVHLPSELLEQVDRRATALGLSRNRYIRRALERAVQTEEGWSPAFRAMLAQAAADPDRREAVDDMRRAIGSARQSRGKPPRL